MVILDTHQYKLTKMLMEKIPKFYPGISYLSVKPRSNFFAERYDTSIIYEFNIYGPKGDIIKNVVVKKRIFNPAYNNDVIKDTYNEFANLQFLQCAGGRRFRTPKVLEAIPLEGILISEKIEGRRLSFYLKKIFQSPWRRKKKEFLNMLFSQVGRWLREYHQIDFNGKENRVNTDDCVHKAESIIGRFNKLKSDKLGKSVIERMKHLQGPAGNYSFPIALKHGDFQPKNILCHNNHVSVLDMDCRKRDISIKDVCNFIIGVKTFNKNLLFSFADNHFMDEILKGYLSEYFQKKAVPYKAIEFMTTLGLLESLENSCKRNAGFVNSFRIIPFYRKALLNLLRFPIGRDR